MKRAITELTLPGIREFRTRQQYKDQTGQDAPEFNFSKPTKTWVDPNAAGKQGRFVQYWTLATNPATGGFLHDAQGRPYLEPFSVPTLEAAYGVNIPPDHSISGSVDSVPTPLRQLNPGESFISDLFGGPKWDDGVVDPTLTQGPGATLNLSDRQIIEAIYKAVVKG